MIWDQDLYIKAWRFAADAHLGQTVPGTDIPYLNHLGNVAMEVMSAVAETEVADPNLAVQAALLHDTIEDTACDYASVKEVFGQPVADGVQALSKNPEAGDKKAQMQDSLTRIRLQPKEIWMVKLADRITNLQAPPQHWSLEKAVRYRDEAQMILDALGEANTLLAARLQEKIENYKQYC